MKKWQEEINRERKRNWFPNLMAFHKWLKAMKKLGYFYRE